MHIADDQFKTVARRLLAATARITVFGEFDPEGGMKHVDVRLHRGEAAQGQLPPRPDSSLAMGRPEDRAPPPALAA